MYLLKQLRSKPRQWLVSLGVLSNFFMNPTVTLLFLGTWGPQTVNGIVMSQASHKLLDPLRYKKRLVSFFSIHLLFIFSLFFWLLWVIFFIIKKMSITTPERQPLLRRSSPSSPSSPSTTLLSSLSGKWPPKYGVDMKSPTQSIVLSPGPQEIPSAIRHRILAGIWLAQFLSVSSFLCQHWRLIKSKLVPKS